MHSADIQAAIKKKGESQASIARRLRVSPTAVAHIIRRTGKSLRIAREVSRITELSLAELFGDTYGYPARVFKNPRVGSGPRRTS